MCFWILDTVNHDVLWYFSALLTKTIRKEKIWHFFLCRKIVNSVLSDFSWIIMKFWILNNLLCNSSILWVDFNVFIFFQRNFLIAHHVFHLQRSFFFARFCDLFYMFFMFEIHDWIQSANKNLKWVTIIRKIQQFCFF